MENSPQLKLHLLSPITIVSSHSPQSPHSSQTHHPAFLNRDERGVTRRSFIKWMGASMALMGIGAPACRRLEKFIVPYNEAPEWSLPGLETNYATCLSFNGYAIPVLASCYDGRPVKLTPTPIYPDSSGLLPTIQGAVLDLYDPHRSKKATFYGNPVSAPELEGAFSAWSKAIKSTNQAGILLPAGHSPLIQSLIEQLLQKNPQLRLYTASFTAPANISTRYRFHKIKRALAIDFDFLNYPGIGKTGDFAHAHSPEGKDYKSPQSSMARLYCIESQVSITGAHADHRLTIRPSQIRDVVNTLHRHIVSHSQAPVSHTLSEHEKQWLQVCARDLLKHPGESALIYPEQGELAALIDEINDALSAHHACVQKYDIPSSYQVHGLSALVADISNLDLLLLLDDSNLVLNSPLGNILAKKLPHIESIHWGRYYDETARLCRWHLPATHPLESWGIERDSRGYWCFRQPVVLPNHAEVAAEEILSGLLSNKGKLLATHNSVKNVSPIYYRARKLFLRTLNPENKSESWAQALRDGYSAQLSYNLIKPSHPKITFTPSGQNPTKGFEILVTHDSRMKLSHQNRNAWLQECPDPITGISWEAVVQISPQDFRKLGGTGSRPMHMALNLPSGLSHWVLCPVVGVASNTLIFPFGLGGETPCASYQKSASSAHLFDENGHLYHIHPTNIALSPISDTELAKTKDIREPLPLHPFNTPPPPPSSTSSGYRWQMTIDTTRCIGCNACIVACRAENNIPIVGREQMAKGRSLDWIRIDRYFDKSGQLTPLPLSCQQCENAPCESVCPVNATVHTDDGLNAMVYARCWGSRYCANNCPYKARKFNFYDYAKASHAQTNVQNNPNVTIRSRGVMEKCTYCVQKIERAKAIHKSSVMKAHASDPSFKINLSATDLILPEGAVHTACQLACPMDAISFGNGLDTKSMVYRTRQSKRFATLLPEFATIPATGYLIHVKNPNPEMSDL